MRLRLVTWNVNGLRRIVTAFGGLGPLLESLHADVVCFQETKLTRGMLERDLALADGWESFFAFTRGKVGYSGVATFCRRDVAVPRHAEEGFTGALALPPGVRPDSAAAAAALHPRWAAAGLGGEELLQLDGEGRVVVTDLGAVVVVNVYGPAITSEERAAERMGYKMRFYQALQLRLDDLLAGGRRVVMCGDLNIAPEPADVCGATPRDFNAQREDRAWLSALMTRGSAPPASESRSWAKPLSVGGASSGGGSDWAEGWAQEAGEDWTSDEDEAPAEALGTVGGRAAAAGAAAPFVDTFRAFHPQRQHAYTCWNTSSGARVNNYGSRIDHILAADGGALLPAPAGRAAGPSGGGAAGAAGTGATAPAAVAACPSWVVAARRQRWQRWQRLRIARSAVAAAARAVEAAAAAGAGDPAQGPATAASGS
ncbi:hypothetical protein GPECTOR_13g812 [Gonium pectorale]|uniref:Endonuclease/exonuclease/phosphatase domain-containing protein n=1 Tax=Gonium pectorale TaxID=33097 RepID=A0A150GNH8_GONPE|nr:hypothetical protein GPECTOR_13g812 [Gonium pectorale]|eukprot:KXZ51325.1 hypothetical protein GPECTOR_13g812 [Gonium pectorale]